MGYTISNISIDKGLLEDKIAYYGIFGKVNNANIKNINIDNITISPVNEEVSYVVGSVFGVVKGNSAISNISVTDGKIDLDNTSEGSNNIGGLSGEVEEEDIIKFTEWMNDFEITDYIDNSSMSFSYESEKEWIIASAKKSSPGNFNIIDLETNELIGSVGFDKIKDVSRSAVLGIFIGNDKYRSNGYGTEAIKLLLEYGL